MNQTDDELEALDPETNLNINENICQYYSVDSFNFAFTDENLYSVLNQNT